MNQTQLLKLVGLPRITLDGIKFFDPKRCNPFVRKVKKTKPKAYVSLRTVPRGFSESPFLLLLLLLLCCSSNPRISGAIQYCVPLMPLIENVPL